MVERKYINAIDVGEASKRNQLLLYMKKVILERNPIKV